MPPGHEEWKKQKMFRVTGVVAAQAAQPVDVLTIPDRYYKDSNRMWTFGVYSPSLSDGGLGLCVYIRFKNTKDGGKERRLSVIRVPNAGRRTTDWTPYFTSVDWPKAWNTNNQLTIRARLLTSRPSEVSEVDWKVWTA